MNVHNSVIIMYLKTQFMVNQPTLSPLAQAQPLRGCNMESNSKHCSAGNDTHSIHILI